MAQAFYRPRFKKQLTGSALAGSNCNMACAAMLADRMTLGQVNVSPDRMRHWSGDSSGMTKPGAAINALAHYNLHVNAYDGSDGFGIEDVRAALKIFRAVSLSGDYGVLPEYLEGDKDFTGNHQIFINEWRPTEPCFLVYDPLADHRRPNIPQAPDWWPTSLIKKYLSPLPGPDAWCLVMRKRTAKAKVPVANIRSGAAVSFPVIYRLEAGQSLNRGSLATIGEAPPNSGSKVWYRVWVPSIAKVGFVHSTIVDLF